VTQTSRENANWQDMVAEQSRLLVEHEFREVFAHPVEVETSHDESYDERKGYYSQEPMTIYDNHDDWSDEEEKEGILRRLRTGRD
jgi:hypothetical protein